MTGEVTEALNLINIALACRFSLTGKIVKSFVPRKGKAHKIKFKFYGQSFTLVELFIGQREKKGQLQCR